MVHILTRRSWAKYPWRDQRNLIRRQAYQEKVPLHINRAQVWPKFRTYLLTTVPSLSRVPVMYPAINLLYTIKNLLSLLITKQAFSLTRQIYFLRNPDNSFTEAITVRESDSEFQALLDSGFRQVRDRWFLYYTLLPCPLGTFANSSSEENQGCTECSPGI